MRIRINYNSYIHGLLKIYLRDISFLHCLVFADYPSPLFSGVCGDQSFSITIDSFGRIQQLGISHYLSSLEQQNSDKHSTAAICVD